MTLRPLPPILWVLGMISPGLKRLKLEFYHLPSCIGNIKNECIYTFTTPIRSNCLDRDKFTFQFKTWSSPFGVLTTPQFLHYFSFHLQKRYLTFTINSVNKKCRHLNFCKNYRCFNNFILILPDNVTILF
jgi:hypothetical protein